MFCPEGCPLIARERYRPLLLTVRHFSAIWSGLTFHSPRSETTCNLGIGFTHVLTKTARAPSAIRELYALPEVNRSKLNKKGSPSMSIERLADVLIALRLARILSDWIS